MLLRLLTVTSEVVQRHELVARTTRTAVAVVEVCVHADVGTAAIELVTLVGGKVTKR